MATRAELLQHLWKHVINNNLRPIAIHNIISRARQRPDDPFADTGPALERLLALGAAPSDICLVRRQAAYDAVFQTLYALGDPGVDDASMLFEELLTADPSGMDGRPGSAEST